MDPPQSRQFRFHPLKLPAFENLIEQLISLRVARRPVYIHIYIYICIYIYDSCAWTPNRVLRNLKRWPKRLKIEGIFVHKVAIKTGVGAWATGVHNEKSWPSHLILYTFVYKVALKIFLGTWATVVHDEKSWRSHLLPLEDK